MNNDSFESIKRAAVEMKALVNSLPINTGGPAFPGNEDLGDPGQRFHSGMSLRDYFAGQALAGLVAFQYGGELGRVFDQQKAIANEAGYERESPQSYTARIAYSLADAMISARE